MPAAHECTQGSAPAPVMASSTQPSACEASGGCTVRCRPKPDAVGTAPASTAVSAGSSTWTTIRCPPGSRRRRSATWTVSPSASAWASSRRAPKSASTLSPRGRSTVAASVHGPATWTLNAPSYPCACSSSPSRSWASRLRARRWSMPGAPPAREPPAGRLQVGAQLGHHGERAAGHGRGSAATGQLGQVRQVRQLAEDEPHRLVEVALVVARVRADAAGERHRGSRPAPSSVARRSSGIGSSTTPTPSLACSRPTSVTNPTWLTSSSGRPKK